MATSRDLQHLLWDEWIAGSLLRGRTRSGWVIEPRVCTLLKEINSDVVLCFTHQIAISVQGKNNVAL